MKILSVSLFCFLLMFKTEAQFLKKIGQKIKDDAEWRVRNKADNQVNKGLDTLIALPTKINKKKKTTTQTPAGKTDDTKPKTATDNKPTGKADENDMTPADGQVTLELSTNSVFAGGTIAINGESVKYKNFTQVEITITGPSVKDTKQVTLAADGKYSAAWIAPDKAGDYSVTVKSSDKKAQQSSKVTVYALPQIANWADENIDLTNKAQDKLKEAVAKAEENISPKDKAALEKKMDEVNDKVADLLKLFKDLNTAGKETADLLKSAKNMPSNLAGNLSALNNNLSDQAKQMRSIEKISKHEAQDNTICEYLVMVNEACAAFSAISNFWSTSLKTILLNITSDKVVPKVVDVVNTNGMQVSSPHDFFPKEIAKIYSMSKIDGESMLSKLGDKGVAGDVVQYASDVLLKTYCGVFKGEIKHDFTVDYKNGEGVTWWKYGVSMQGALFLRYPKEGSKGKIIKMKGNIEGNATKFTFYQNVEVEDGFVEGGRGKIKVIELKVLKPAAVPFVSSLNDDAGFGAVARTIATPACFNIAVDAEYDVDANKIKLFLTRALVDFSPAVVNQLIFLEVGPDLLPYIKRMMFPILPVHSTLGAIVRDHNEFTVNRIAKGNVNFSGKNTKHFGNKTDKQEIDLNLSITAKKDN